MSIEVVGVTRHHVADELFVVECDSRRMESQSYMPSVTVWNGLAASETLLIVGTRLS